MCKKLIYLLSFMFVLSILSSVQASPVSIDPSVEVIIGTDGIVPPTQSNYKTYDMQIRNTTNHRRVTLVSFDISGLRALDQDFTNMSFSNLGLKSGTVDVYGVIESQDNISSNLSWTTAPGVENFQTVQYSVRLDTDDLTDKLLSFNAPALKVRESTGTSQALDDFLNSDTDGIVTFLLAPPKDGTDVLMRTTQYPGGGMTLNGEIITYLLVTTFEDDFEVAQNYLTDGLGAYGGMLNGTISALDASTSREGELYLESSNASWDPGPGPMLYVNVKGDFIVTVKVTDFAGTAAEPLFHNSAGITARDPASDGGVENWVSMDYFPTWTAFVARSTTNGSRRELGQPAGSWTGVDTFAMAEQYPYIQLERDGDNFYPRISADGVTFIPLTDPSYQGIYDGTQAPLIISRPDLPDTLQIGLNNATFTENVGYVAFDDLSIQTQFYPTDPGTENLVAYYALDGDVSDSSGNGLDGVMVGDPTFADGMVGMGLQLDGIDDYVDCGNDPNYFDFTEQITLAVWVNVFDFGNGENDPWIGKGDHSWCIKGHRTGYAIEFFVYEGGWNWISADVGDLNGEWHHAVGTFDGSLLKIYVDGIVVATKEYVGGIATSTHNVTIGTNSEAGGRFSEGVLDEARIYNKALSNDEILYIAGQEIYTYDGDAAEYGTGDFDSLDGTWDRENSSDAWDGTGPGDPDGAPGGAGVLEEDGVNFLRIQDIGDPRGQGFSDPSNRKIYFGHDVGLSTLDGASFEFRIRLATTPPLDGLDPNTAWPEGGDGGVIQDRGKGMIGMGEAAAGGAISFSLAKAGELAAIAGFEDVTTDVLLMNNLVGTESSDQVDTGAGGAVAVNYIPLDDATAWNTFTVKIAAGGIGTHIVSVSVNGGPAQSYNVTVGADNDIPGNYIAMGSSGTGAITAFDVDYITFK